MSSLEACDLAFAYGREQVLREVSLQIPDGKVTALIGANGSGKSTLLRLFARLLRPGGGSVLLDGRPLHDLPTRQVARELAVLPQNPEAPPDLTVSQLALLGRYPHRSRFGGVQRRDREIVERALARCGLAGLAERTLGTLSGGQRRLAWIAMTLAQETGVLLLDEPTAALDIAHALEVMDLLRALSRDGGQTIVVAIHDLPLAARYADHVVAVTADRQILAGSPADLLTPETLRRIYQVEVVVVPDPRTGMPLCIPYRSTPEVRPWPGSTPSSTPTTPPY
jgi:iron complex transport system ATP-binding protein